MAVRKQTFAAAWMAAVVGLAAASVAASRIPAEVSGTRREPVLLWRNPSTLGSRDLFYGPGGRRHQPRGPFTFLKEDRKGSNPKLVVRDQDGVRWKVKLGGEARPETAATRIVWAAGYFADEDYFLDSIEVRGLPPRLHRGRQFVFSGGIVSHARLERELHEKIGSWSWRRNPFSGTRELNGLRVLMALISNWDLKDENNSVYDDGSEVKYLVSDVGSSFGTPGRSFPFSKEKGNLESYRSFPLLLRITPRAVDFRAPDRSNIFYLLNPYSYFHQLSLEWIGEQIPRADARWIGRILARLSHRQIEDAFRAAGYSTAEVNGFSQALENRIAQLSDL